MRMLYGAPPDPSRRAPSQPATETATPGTNLYIRHAHSLRGLRDDLAGRVKEFDEAIALSLGRARAEAGFTLRQVSRALGVSHVAVSDWEKGNRRPSAERIDQLFDLYEGRPNPLWSSDPELT